MLQCGARWRDCPPDYVPYTTICNRFNRWAKRGHWQAIFKALVRCGNSALPYPGGASFISFDPCEAGVTFCGIAAA